METRTQQFGLSLEVRRAIMSINILQLKYEAGLIVICGEAIRGVEWDEQGMTPRSALSVGTLVIPYCNARCGQKVKRFVFSETNTGTEKDRNKAFMQPVLALLQSSGHIGMIQQNSATSYASDIAFPMLNPTGVVGASLRVFMDPMRTITVSIHPSVFHQSFVAAT